MKTRRNRKSLSLKLETLERRLLLGNAADLLVLGDADLVNDGTVFMGNTYNGFEQNSEVATYQAIPGELTRVSFLDPDGDLVFVEFGGAGATNIRLEGFMADVDSPYDQPGTTYSKGLATITITGSDQTTFVSVFSLGNDTTRVDLALVNADTFATADGRADIRAIFLDGVEGQVNHIAGINAANANFTDNATGAGNVGIVGLDVRVDNYLFIGDITATGNAFAQILIDPFSLLTSDITGLESEGVIQITGGDVSDTSFFAPVTITPFPVVSIDGQLSIDAQVLIASQDVVAGDFDHIDVSVPDVDSVTYTIDQNLDNDPDLTLTEEQQAALDAFIQDPSNYDGLELIFEGDPTGLDFDFPTDVTEAVIFTGNLDTVDIIGWSFKEIIIEGDTNDVLISTDFNDDPADPEVEGDINHNDVLDPNEGDIDKVMIWGDITGTLSVEAHNLPEVWFGTGTGGGFSGDVDQHADSSAIVFAFGKVDDPGSIGSVNTFSGDAGTANTAANTTFAKILDGDVTGNTFNFPDGVVQNSNSGPLVHLVDSNVNDGVVRWGGTIDAGSDDGDTSTFYNLFEYESGTPDDDPDTTTVDESAVSATPDRGHITVASGGNLVFNGTFVTSSGKGVLSNFDGVSTDDGDITIDDIVGNSSGVWNLGLISAKGKEVAEVLKASVWVDRIEVENDFEGIWADYDISISGGMIVGGDIDGFHAGNDFRITGTITAHGSLGDMTAGDDIFIDGNVTANGIGNITAGDEIAVTGSFVESKNTAGDGSAQAIGDISAGGNFTVTTTSSTAGFKGASFGDISAQTIKGSQSNIEFQATNGNFGNLTVINGDFNNMSDVDGDGDVDDDPAGADDDPLGVNADLLDDVIFQAKGDIGDIWLQQDTDTQSIARATQTSTKADWGVGFAASGSIGEVHIKGGKGFDDTEANVSTLMDPFSSGGLFILAGDSDAAGDSGTASDDPVSIGNVIIEVDLTADDTFGGDTNTAGGGFVIASGIQPVAGATAGIYATGVTNSPIDVTATVVETTAAGSIGDITLNDISRTSISSLVLNPTTVVNTTATVNASAIIIADELGTVTHQRRGVDQTVLQLDASPFITVFHRIGSAEANIDGDAGDLLVVVI